MIKRGMAAILLASLHLLIAVTKKISRNVHETAAMPPYTQ